MKHLKRKLMMTLALLLTAATGAWAQETPLLTIESKGNTSFTSESKTFGGMVTVTFSNTVANYGDNMGWYSTGEASLTVAGINGYTITSCKFYTEDGPASSGYTVEGESPSVYLYEAKVYLDDSKSVKIGSAGVTKIEVYGAAAATATTVDLTRGTGEKINEWTLTNGMPAGNVTVSVEYYPQATMADGAVTAATDVKATTEDALVTIDKSKLTGVAKLMYFVSTDAEATAPAYDAEGWTDVLPTAANYTEAGNVNVWYYAVGADSEDPDKTYSDGDICAKALTVTLGAAPLWNAEFDLTDAPAEDQAPGVWKTDITGDGVKKGTPVTVTYSGDRKVIGVKAEKKAAPKLLNFSPLGQIFYYYEGETWGEAIQNHPENAANGWYIEEFGITVMYKGRALCDSAHDDDITKDTVVNPNGGYLWGPES